MLLGLSGPAQSGKDTVYGILRALSFEGPLTPYVVRRDAFADRLKISAARSLGIDGTPEECIAFCNKLKGKKMWVEAVKEPVNWPDPSEALTSITGREFLQRYGTEAHRDVFAQNFWVNAVLPEGYPSDIEREKTLLVLTDCRFANEAERVHECGGQVWRIERPEVQIAESAHASEQPLPDEMIDHIIINDGDLDYLAGKVRSAIESVLLCSSG